MINKGKVLFLDSVHEILAERLSLAGYACEFDFSSSTSEIKKKVAEYVGIVIRSRFILDRDFLSVAKDLRWIARSGSGLENIDLVAAKDLNIAVYNSPEGNRDAVAEHALAMLLSLFNNLNIADREVRSQLWNREKNRGVELRGKTAGIIGLGQMGSAFAERLVAMGCKVIAHDLYLEKSPIDEVTLVSLDDLFDQSQIVSLHLPLNFETEWYADTHFFQRITHPIYFINTSRGKILRTAALVDAMKQGKILGACLDVLEYEETSFEKINLNHPEFTWLAAQQQVILSPHIAGWTKESYFKLSNVLADKILSAEEGI
jgi:D-3-phosphoglycerate dehydrogenase